MLKSNISTIYIYGAISPATAKVFLFWLSFLAMTTEWAETLNLENLSLAAFRTIK
jgi:hypothetical protein